MTTGISGQLTIQHARLMAVKQTKDDAAMNGRGIVGQLVVRLFSAC